MESSEEYDTCPICGSDKRRKYRLCFNCAVKENPYLERFRRHPTGPCGIEFKGCVVNFPGELEVCSHCCDVYGDPHSCDYAQWYFDGPGSDGADPPKELEQRFEKMKSLR
jgi:hypothetical protein